MTESSPGSAGVPPASAKRQPTAAPDPAATAVLSVRGLCKYFPIWSKGLRQRQTGTVKAVDQVSFDLLPGQTLGLVGESGCGKTTCSRSILRAIDPTAGAIWFRPEADGPAVDLATQTPRQLRHLRTRMQMIFQDPFSSLNPRMSIERIVAEPLLIHRVGSRSERRARIVDMLERVGLSAGHLKRYPHEFSGGQRQRIGIARALILHPRLVVADEAVSALDVSVQAQVINLLAELQRELQLTFVFVAHDLSVVRHIADQVAVMYAGRIVEMGSTSDLFERPQHPYTRSLLAAVPQPDPDQRMPAVLAGEVANPACLPSGCAFHPRCSECFAPCRDQAPELQRLKARQVACHLYGNDTAS